MEEFEREKSIMQGKGEWDESEHPRDEEGKFTEKGSSTKKLTKKKKSGIIFLDIEEYAKFCYAIRTWYADKIPRMGSVYLDTNYYHFKYNKRTEQLVCIFRCDIETNRELINDLERKKWR